MLLIFLQLIIVMLNLVAAYLVLCVVLPSGVSGLFTSSEGLRMFSAYTRANEITCINFFTPKTRKLIVIGLR